MNDTDELIWTLAGIFYEQWVRSVSYGHIPLWEDAPEEHRTQFLIKARSLMEDAELEWEYACQIQSHIGLIEYPVMWKGLAELQVEEMQEEHPEYKARVVRRIVGQWEEM